MVLVMEVWSMCGGGLRICYRSMQAMVTMDLDDNDVDDGGELLVAFGWCQ